MKKKLLIILFTSFWVNGHTQDLKRILNDSLIQFRLGIPEQTFKNGTFWPTPGRHVSTNIPEKYINRPVKLKYSEWIKLLENNTTGFSTSLVLYEITSKNAFNFIGVENKNNWIKMLKEEDIEYWKKYLKNNKLK